MQQEKHRLCAVMRARPRDEEPALVRLYISDGQYMVPPDGGVEPILHRLEVAGKVARHQVIQAVVSAVPMSLLDATVPCFKVGKH
ncbi:hypothetical protein DL765_005875 [Monosporascus sp. GIB2]|nr:hypothetical protein DL765_005875 [Monosporascus sp. GIB2]